MTITQLRYFLAICKFGRIRIASERLHVSEPTISVSIKRLEDELGCPLFIRNRGQLLLTEKGRTLQEKATEVVEGFDRLEADMQQPQKNQHTICLGAPASLSEHLCPPLISEFTEIYPFVLFETPTFSPPETAQLVEDGKLELAICDQLAVTSRQLVYAPVLRSTLSGYVRSDHSLAGNRHVTPKMLQDEGLIMLRQSGLIAEEMKRWFYTGGAYPNFFMYSNRDLVNVTLSMIRKQDAVAFFLDELYACNQQIQPFPPEDIATFTLDPPLEFEFGIIRKKGSVLSKDAQRFFDFCRQHQFKQKL